MVPRQRLQRHRVSMNPGQGRGLKGQSAPLRKFGDLVLAWGMRNISSMITRRDEVVVHAQPGEYTCETSRLIRLHLSSANQWVQLSTVRLVMEIHNTSLTAPLEFLVPCNAIFRAAGCSLKVPWSISLISCPAWRRC